MTDLKYPVALDAQGKIVRPQVGVKPHTCLGCEGDVIDVKMSKNGAAAHFRHKGGKLAAVGCSQAAFKDRVEKTAHDAVVDYIFEQSDEWLRKRMPKKVVVPTGARFKDDRYVPKEEEQRRRYKPDIGLMENPRNEDEVFLGIEVVHTHPPEERRLDNAYYFGHVTVRLDVREGGVDAWLADCEAENAGEEVHRLASWVDAQRFIVMDKPKRVITEGLCEVFEKSRRQLLDMWYEDFKELESSYASELLKREVAEQTIIDLREAAMRREREREFARMADIREAQNPANSNLARQEAALRMQDDGRLDELKKVAPFGISVGGRPLTSTGRLINWDEFDKMREVG